MTEQWGKKMENSENPHQLVSAPGTHKAHTRTSMLIPAESE